MNSNLSMLDAWLNGTALDFSEQEQDFWDPGFDGESRIVYSRLGPYHKLFLCPPKFIRRFYHSVYPLPIEDWHLDVSTLLYGGLCTIEAHVTVHFQATLPYVERNTDALPDVNRHIKTGYEGLIRTATDAELRNLKEGDWIQTGLNDVERRIENIINETLILRQIKCRTICALKPCFEELPDDSRLDGRFMQESVYLNIMKKNFEFRERHNRERQRQEEQLELERLKQLDQVNELKKRQLILESENIKRLLKAQGRQNIEQYAIEAELHAEKVKHETHLREIEKAAELRFQKEQKLREMELERQLQEQRLAHEALMKVKEMEVDYKVQEAELLEKQKVEEQLEAARIAHQTRLREMQLLAEIKELELRVEVTKNKDQYLHRQIEWLVLDKQRAELTRAIKEAEQDVDDTFG
ncbi:MAG: hypothetical protein ACU841_04405 [Gammaproteobacteria bacterium]